MTDQPSLFAVDRTVAITCLVCAAVRAAGADKTPDCEHDRDREPRAKRPAACLNAHDPKHAPIHF